MECWDRFDRKTVLYFTGNKDTRVPGMEKELKRVGLDGSDRQWQFPSPIDRCLLRGMAHEPVLEKGGFFNATMGHYRAIATAYHLGCGNVLLMEDDIRFLKDAGLVSEIVSSLPGDYDIAMFDLFPVSWKDTWRNHAAVKKWAAEKKVNDHWAHFDEMYSGGCYALSRKAMKKMLFLFEAVETDKRIGKFRVCDHFLKRKYFWPDAKMYFARKNACVQRSVGNSGSLNGTYVAMGVDFSEYAEA